ncbi:MAG: phospholipase effector Tle1 domain-containing protein [Paraglaciecola chathamensis]
MECRKKLKRLLNATFGCLLVTGCTTTSPQTLVNSNTYTETNINDYSVAAFATCPLNSSEIGLLPDINIGTLTPKFQPNSTSKKQLTVYEANEWLQIVRASLPHEAPAINLPNFEKKIFFAIFDGTYNDRDDESLPPTVPAKLSLQLEELSKIRSDIEVKYYNGVGTRVNWFNKLYEGITGEGSVDRAEIAFDDLVDYSDVISDTPHVYAIGFSRGAASARHFLNLANEHLIQHDDSSNRALGLSNSRSFGLLFDTVATGQA